MGEGEREDWEGRGERKRGIHYCSLVRERWGIKKEKNTGFSLV